MESIFFCRDITFRRANTKQMVQETCRQMLVMRDNVV